MLLVVLLFAWTTLTGVAPGWLRGPQRDHYNLLVDGMLQGHLSLDLPVPPEVLASRDPYDPAQRPPGIALHDASLYHGKYYIYFGVAPAVVLLLPFRAITGVSLPVRMGVLVFAVAGFLVFVATWRRARHRFFPALPAWLSAAVIVALGLCSLVVVLLRRGSIWELPISSGYFFVAVAHYCVLRAIDSVRASCQWLLCASLGLGGAVASRPTYLLAGGMILVALSVCWRADLAVPAPRRKLRLLAAAFGPLAVVGVLLALYNFERFGNPLEFGQSYQLSGMYEAHLRHFDLAYFAKNLAVYGFAPFELSRYFPFIHQTRISPGPHGYVGVEEPFGALRYAPWFLAALCVVPRWHKLEGACRWWLAAVVAALGAGVVPLVFFSAVGRYEPDFLATSTLLAGVGIAVANDWAVVRSRIATAVTRLVSVVLIAGSSFVCFLFGVVVYHDLEHHDPSLFSALARVSDYPGYCLDRMSPHQYGTASFDVAFPNRDGGREVLMQAGWFGDADRVLVEYDARRAVRLRLQRDGGDEVVGSWMTLPTPGGHHRIEVSLGSLYPPEESPWFAGKDVRQVRHLTRRAKIVLDGQTAIDCYRRFESAAETLRIAPHDRVAGAEVFSGQVGSVRREHWPVSLPPQPPSYGAGSRLQALSIELRLPEHRIPGLREPLVCTGTLGAADFLFVQYVDATAIRFGLEHWGKPPRFSPPLLWPAASGAREITVRLGSFPAEWARSETVVELSIDGRLFWKEDALFYPAESQDVFVGTNPIGGTGCVTRFSGVTERVRRLDETDGK